MAIDGRINEYYFPLNFIEYMQKEQLKCSCASGGDHFVASSEWLFWCQEDHEIEPALSHDNCADSIPNVCAIPKFRDDIRLALQKMILCGSNFTKCSLVQFWAATKTLEGRIFLTTQSQPFALGRTDYAFDRQRLCEYRMKMCREYKFFYADAESGEEQLGLLGRVFLHKFPESSPDVEYYTTKEYPQRDLALLCNIIGCWAMPVFEHPSQTCVGVLEIVSLRNLSMNWDNESVLSDMSDSFQEFGLQCFGGYKICEMQNDQKIHSNQLIQATRNFSSSSSDPSSVQSSPSVANTRPGFQDANMVTFQAKYHSNSGPSSEQSSASVANTRPGFQDANMVTIKAKYHLNCDPFSDSDPSFVQSSTRVANARPGFQDADMVTIKAKYASIERVLKLSLPCRLVELREEVAIWLMLEAGTYNVGYKDEEDGFVLIACDEDLQAYMHDSISQGNTSPMVLLEPKEPATNFNPNLNRHRSSSYRCPIKLNLCMDDILNETNKTNDLDQTTGPGMDPKPAARMVHPVHNKAFHSLEEFDEGNRSCKKQCLDGHNRRRREPQPEPLSHPRPTISHHFSMLHVLDLSNTEIKSLPQSFSRLVALQKLYLRNCECLMELPPEIGELTNLEVLDLEGTEILCLPKEIAKLVKLTCLRVSFYGYANQTVIPRKVLSNLSRLNELIIDVTPYGEWWDIEVEVIIDDLCSLKELRALKLYLPTAKLLEELTFIVPSLVNFRFTVGRCEEHFISRLPRDVEEEFNNQEKLEKGLKYVNGDRIPNEITKVFNHVNAFFLQCHWTANSLSEFGHENLNEVKFCLVMECNEFRTIIDSEQFYQGNHGRAEYEDLHDFGEAVVLGSLERLIVCYMKNMESIWKGPVGKGSMSSLKSLALHTCPNLTTLFTIDMLSNLINLEELLVEDCPKIDSLVSLKNSCSKSGPFLPNLKKISLLELPGLVSISSGLCIAPKLERMVIFYCPKLEKLSSMDISSTNLKVIKGEEEWWYALKWYESDVSTEHEGYLTSLFIPLRTDGDLFAQLTEDYIAAYDQGKFGSYK